MISVTRLLCDEVGPGDNLRYERRESPRPVVVWNYTRQCNLKCLHCYATADTRKSPDEMDTKAGEAFIRDLAEFRIPVLLFSGGEPMLRKDLLSLAAFAKEQGVRPAISTNGTLITEDVARDLKRVGFAEVGISLDGIGAKNDHFRGKEGAFDSALRGIRACVSQGLRVSLRQTLTLHNYQDVPAIFDLVEKEGVNRVCFYHLAYSGRGAGLRDEDISHDQTRDVVDTICERTIDLHKRGFHKEILTVSSHTDGVYLYLKLREKDPERAERVLGLLRTSGGNQSGIKIGSVDDVGNVHADQFWWHHTLGNVRQRKFGDIWLDETEPLLKGLKNRAGLLKGRCGRCHYVDICNGNLRVRAEAVYDDVWAQDPACYLTEEEILG